MRSTSGVSLRLHVCQPAGAGGWHGRVLTAEPGTVPNALLHNLKHNKVLHEHNLFVTVRNHEVPWIGLDKRLASSRWGTTAGRWWCNYGFKNDPDLPRALEQIRGRGCELEPDDDQLLPVARHVVPTIGGGMAPWRESCSPRCTTTPAVRDFLNLPNNSVVELGSRSIEIPDAAVWPVPSPCGFFRGDLSLSAFFTAGVCGGAGGLYQLGGHRVPGRSGVPAIAGTHHLLDVGAGRRHGAVFAGARR